MDIYLNSEALENYKLKAKLYQYLSSNLGSTYFKATSDFLSVYLKGSLGIFRTDIPCQSESNEIKYFSLDFNKWTNALAKFEGCDGITLSINRNLVKLSVEDSPDVINLAISAYGDDNAEVTSLDDSLDKKKEAIMSSGLSVDITEEVADDLALANSLFIPQQDVNSIGLGKDGLIYAVRSVILKAFFTESLSDSFFKGLKDGEDYIYLHKYTLGFINHVYKTNPSFYFDSSYSTLYWEDGNTAIALTQPSKELTIPSDEDLESFIPLYEDSGKFSVEVSSLKDSLGFFDGFYSGSVWKPIKFEAAANKDVSMRYAHAEADIIKSLYITPTLDGEFVLDSDTVKKVLSKVKDKRLDKTAPLEIEFSYDDEAPGVLCEVGNCYRIIFCKLSEDD